MSSLAFAAISYSLNFIISIIAGVYLFIRYNRTFDARVRRTEKALLLGVLFLFGSTAVDFIVAIFTGNYGPISNTVEMSYLLPIFVIQTCGIILIAVSSIHLQILDKRVAEEEREFHKKHGLDRPF